jgi:hypothetical protein
MKDNDLGKGAREEDNPRQKPQARFKGQLSHRESDPLIKSSDTDFPEPGENPEHSGEPEEPEGAMQNQDPGHLQKRNQGDQKEDPLVA